MTTGKGSRAAADADLLERSVVRIRDTDGGVAGTGFVIGDRLVCTCAHVVAIAAGAGPDAREPPAAPVAVDFPLLRPGGDVTVPATVLRWISPQDDDTGDIAVLELRAPAPDAAAPARLSPAGAAWRQDFRTFGFPSGHDHGVWVTGRTLGRQGAGWVQLETADGPPIARGFSGAPVWDADAGEVIGMVVAAERGATTAYLIPAALLRQQAGAELDQTEPTPRPYRGLEPFREEDARFFFGRDDAVERLSSLLAREGIVVVAGPSGSGKSSLVRAGLWPRLRAGGAAVAEFRPVPDVTPRKLLAHALAPLLGTSWTGELTDEDLTVLAGTIRAADRDVVVLCDQLEELVASSPATARELFELVRRLVAAATSAGRSRLRIVFTVRSAALEALLTAEFARVLENACLHLHPMTTAELAEAVTGPARLAAVTFEDGLVNRILTDARDAPGQLPLVELALTRLWDARRGGTLTHAAYDRFEGIGGVVAAYAEDVFARRLTEPSRGATERLLIQLVRPGTDDAFAASPMPLDHLPPELRAAATELSVYRLVVIRQDPGQPAVAALAHEALIREWPRLRGWLRDAQDFRRWQEQLRATLEPWEQSTGTPTGSDSGTLLRGTPLSVAETWLAGRPDGVTPTERRYIQASRDHRRRGRRLRRTVTAMVAALAVIASGTAVVAYDQRQDRALEQRRRAAVALAQEARGRSGVQMLSAMQFAQAAWRHDPTFLGAYSALFESYVGVSTMEQIRDTPWEEGLVDVSVSEDARRIATQHQDGTIAVWTGVLEGSPQAWEVTIDPAVVTLRLSADGRRLAVLDDRGAVTLWDTAQRRGPQTLRPPTTQDRGTVNSLEFSPDGALLVVTTFTGEGDRGRSAVEVWDTARRTQRPHRIAAPAHVRLQVGLIAADGRHAWFREIPLRGDPVTRLRDLTTGAALQTVPGDAAFGNRALADQQDGQLTVWDATTGAERFTLPTFDDLATILTVDVTGRYALTLVTSDGVAPLVLVDLETGDTAQIQAPYGRRGAGEQGFGSVFVVTHTAAGRPVLHAVEDEALVRFEPARPTGAISPFPLTVRDGAYALDLDGGMLALYALQPDRWEQQPAGLQLLDLERQRQVRVAPPGDVRLSNTPKLAFTPDGERLLAVGDDGTLRVLSVPDLTIERSIELPALPAAPGDVVPGRDTSVVPLSDDEVAVLHAGMFTFWSVSSGQPTGEPLPLRTGFDDTRSGDVVHPLATGRPGSARQVVVMTPDAVEIWDLDRREVVSTFRPPEGLSIGEVFTFPGTPFIGVDYGETELWDPQAPGGSRRRIGLPEDAKTIGMTADGKLAVEVPGAEEQLQIWDLEAGVAAATLSSSASFWLSAGQGRLLGFADSGLVTLDTDPEGWFDHLCHLSDSDYTGGERALLPAGADDTPPCDIE